MASELVSSFGLINGHPDETGNQVYKKRAFLLTARFRIELEVIKSTVVNFLDNLNIHLASNEELRVSFTNSYLVEGFAYLILMDASPLKLDKMEVNLMSVNAKLLSASAYGELPKVNLPYNGIKCFYNDSNPLSDKATGYFCFMVLPTTNKLKKLGFDIELLEKLKPVQPPKKTFTSSTHTFKPPVFSHLAFPVLGAPAPVTNPPPVDTKAAEAETVVPPPPVETKAAALVVPQVDRIPVKSPVPAQIEPVEQKIPTTKRRLNVAVINGSRVVSDGMIIPLGENSFMLDGAKFLVVNNKPEQVEDPDWYYTV